MCLQIQLKPLETQYHAYQINKLLWLISNTLSWLCLNKNQDWHLVKVHTSLIHENKRMKPCIWNIDNTFKVLCWFAWLRHVYTGVKWNWAKTRNAEIAVIFLSFPVALNTCKKNEWTYLHLSMSPLGDQCDESEAGNRGWRSC